MRILLNLLPSEKKEALTSRFRYRFFLWQTALVFCLELYYVAVLGGIYFISNYNVSIAREALVAFDQYNVEARKLVSFQDKFKETNTLIDTIARYERLHLHWNELLFLLNRLTPEGVVITGLTTKEYTVSIAGEAATRELFLVFEKALKEDECVSDVRVPISNLFTQKEVDFQI
jgi:Tfp pilus assembly protein PilN